MSSELAAVERAMRILSLLSDYPDGLGVSEISDLVQVQKATASRILSTLQTGGYVSQNERSGLFTLTWSLVAMAYRYADSRPFREIARPVLRDVAGQTGEMFHLAVVENDDLIFVEEVEGSNPLRIASLLGLSAPLHATASGKVWLASLPEEKALALVTQRGMPALTEQTITDPLRLLEELREIRTRGYALAVEEANKSVVAIAVPVCLAGQPVRAVLAVMIPAFEASPARLTELQEICHQTAQLLAERLPHRYR